MDWLVQFFTWWRGQTLNTRFHTWRHGELVGEDQYGNKYFRTRGGAKDPTLGFQRRWVIYNGESEASRVPPGWYGWLHHQTDESPVDAPYSAREWELPHLPNMTGTPYAWRPQGSTLSSGLRPPATGDYKPWSPDQ